MLAARRLEDCASERRTLTHPLDAMVIDWPHQRNGQSNLPGRVECSEA